MASSTITEDYIEKLCRKKISDVVELNLSDRKMKRIDVAVFQKMSSLTVLNLSNNTLKTLPLSMGLTALRRLDVSDNCLGSLEFVENMPQLEELFVEGNGLQVADKLIATLLCQSLKKIDGRSTSSWKTAVQNCCSKFLPVVETTWVENFSDNYVDGINNDKLDVVMQALVEKVKSCKLCAPGVPPAFREYLINKLATDLVMQAATGSFEPQSSKQVSEQIRQRNNEPMETDSDGPEHFTSPSSKQGSCPPVSDYIPHRFIRCHFCDKNAMKKGHTDNDPTDETTVVWCCAMEPDVNDTGKTTGVVATCGGDTVCLIDCGTGQVMKRYKQAKEEFYSLAWTVMVLKNDSNSRTNILAVGGFNGHLRLLHPAQLVCYAEYGSGRPNRTVASYYYNCLMFHPQVSSWLFCGSSDTTITLFDIGVPQGTDYKTEIRPLMIFVTSPHALVVNIAFNVKTGHLVAGTENGCYAWDANVKMINSQPTLKQRKSYMQIALPASSKSFVDGMVMVDSDYIACKCVEDGCIHILNITEVLQKQSVGKVYGLEWIKTETKYISLGSSHGLLACGDDKGSLWLYNIKSLLANRRNYAGKFLAPSRILTWPECLVDDTSEESRKMVDVLDPPQPLVINCVAISHDGDFIVAGTDCNLVCIWRRMK